MKKKLLINVILILLTYFCVAVQDYFLNIPYDPNFVGNREIERILKGENSGT